MQVFMFAIIIACCSIALTKADAPYAGCGCHGMRTKASALCHADYVIKAKANRVIHREGLRKLQSVDVREIIYLTDTTRLFGFNNKTALEVVQQGLVEMPMGKICAIPLVKNKRYIISGFFLTSNRDNDEWVMTTGDCEYVQKITADSPALSAFNSLLADNSC